MASGLLEGLTNSWIWGNACHVSQKDILCKGRSIFKGLESLDIIAHQNLSIVIWHGWINEYTVQNHRMYYSYYCYYSTTGTFLSYLFISSCLIITTIFWSSYYCNNYFILQETEKTSITYSMYIFVQGQMLWP